MAAVHAGPHGTVHPMAWSEPRSPTQISSPSNQLPLNGEAARRGSALLRVETTAQSADSAPPVSPQACKRHTPDLNPGNRVCFSRSASLEDLRPQIPAAPPGPGRAPCASRLSPHHLLWGTQHCAARLASPARRRVQLGRTAGLHPPGTPLLSLPPPLSRPGHLVCLMAEVIRLLQNIPAPRSLFHPPDPSNNGHHNPTTSATEDCTAGLPGPLLCGPPTAQQPGHLILPADWSLHPVSSGLPVPPPKTRPDTPLGGPRTSWLWPAALGSFRLHSRQSQLVSLTASPTTPLPMGLTTSSSAGSEGHRSSASLLPHLAPLKTP